MAILLGVGVELGHDRLSVVHVVLLSVVIGHAVGHVGRRVVLTWRARSTSVAMRLLLSMLAMLLVPLLLLQVLLWLVMLSLLHLHSHTLLLRHSLRAHHHIWISWLLVTWHGHTMLTLHALHLRLGALPFICGATRLPFI